MKNLEGYMERDRAIIQTMPKELATALFDWFDKKANSIQRVSLQKIVNKMRLNAQDFCQVFKKQITDMDPEGRDYIKFKNWLKEKYPSRDRRKVLDQWLFGDKDTGERGYADSRGWKFNRTRNRGDRKNVSSEKQETVWTWEDVLKGVNSIASVMWKACFALQGECGLRPLELSRLKKSDIIQDKFGYKIRVEGAKNTGLRYCRISSSQPYLLTWLDAHPIKEDGPLWIVANRQCQWIQPSESWFNKTFLRITQACGVEKPANVNWFRHCSQCTKAWRGWSPMELADYHGNSIGTATRYYLLAKRGTSEKAVMRDIGQAVEEEAPVNKYLPKICGICGVTNTFDAKVCKKCGNAMSIEAANERGLEFETMKKEVAALKEMMIQITLEKTTPQKK